MKWYMYKCTYQENLGEDGYLDLFQDTNPTGLKDAVDVCDGPHMFAAEGTVEFQL